MIKIDFCLTNPWTTKCCKFKSLFTRAFQLSKNKTFEFDSYFDPEIIFELGFEITPRRRDHGGIALTIGLFTYVVELSVRDSRHWDFHLDKWSTYEKYRY